MSIHTLSSQIINQISAGEIIDSPAAVVKELMENSIDAGATKININIYNGGIKSINLCDNGCGIFRYDLKKSIENHSTSKIFTIEDLGNITTLGFRGEALASISAISRLEISSSISNEECGWQLYSERSFSKILKLQPIAHPKGTSIKVLDLFYNVPVRRKHLKTEHAEFIKIREIIKKITLSRQDITVFFSHNNKLVKKYIAVRNINDRIFRLKSLCGKNFIEQLYPLKYNFKRLNLTGWISFFSTKKKEKVLRYYYVNKRVVYGKVLNHAVNQALNEIFGSNELVSVILYLEVPLNYININIHPNKREIYFYEFRIIHSFVYQSILHTLHKLISQTTIKENLDCWMKNNKNTAGINFFSCNKNKLQDHNKLSLNNNVDRSSSFKLENKNYKKISFFTQVISIVKKRYVLIAYQEELALVSLKKIMLLLIEFKLNQGISKGLKIQYLLKPAVIKISNRKLIILSKYKVLLQGFGFDISIQKECYVIHTIPCFLKCKEVKYLINLIIQYLSIIKEVSKSKLSLFIANNISINVDNWSYLQIISSMLKLEKYLPDVIKSPPSSLLQKIHITPLISDLK